MACGLFRTIPIIMIANSHNANSNNILNELDQQIYNLYPNNEPSINLDNNLPSSNSTKNSSISLSTSLQIEPDIIMHAIIVKELGYLLEQSEDISIFCGSQIISKKDLPKNIETIANEKIYISNEAK